MKKALVILFALGLVFSFSAPVMATDVSFSGEYRVRGFYDSNSALAKDSTSSAYYDQRFRLGAVFQVAEGLKVTARFDAMEGDWGNTNTRGGQNSGNIRFDYAYVTFMTKIGEVKAGYMANGVWGTTFGNDWATVGKIVFTTKLADNLALGLEAAKLVEADRKNFTTDANAYSDYDSDSYSAYLVYLGEGTTAGLLYNYGRNANDPAGASASLSIESLQTTNVLAPYFKTTIGDLYLEGELGWLEGELTNRAGGAKLKDLEGLRYYLMARYNLGSAYVGATFAYVQGDDPNSGGTKENALTSGGDWNPGLILFHDYQAGLANVGTAVQTNTSMDNGYIYKVFAGTAIDKLSVKASLLYAKADVKPTNYVDDDYGTEFDLEASYKIYDNLTYSVGFGYLWAGDYYKATSAATKIDDTYLLMNSLQVTF